MLPRNLATFLLLFIISGTSILKAQTPIPLYSDSIPNSLENIDYEQTRINEKGILLIEHVTQPTLTPYLADPESATGESVIICPGGGYYLLAAGHEGADVAKALNEQGINGFVLKYRLPRDSTMKDKRIGPLQDAQRAIQLVRSNAEKWKLDPDKIGIMGFSAGGHLASTAGTQFTREVIPNPENLSLRPDFMVLIYPVISADTTVGHSGSFTNLLGKTPSKEDLLQFSSEKQVTLETPPTYLVHAKDDQVNVENSMVFARALEAHDVPVSMTIYETGGHGFGLKNPEASESWLDAVVTWIRQL